MGKIFSYQDFINFVKGKILKREINFTILILGFLIKHRFLILFFPVILNKKSIR